MSNCIEIEGLVGFLNKDIYRNEFEEFISSIPAKEPDNGTNENIAWWFLIGAIQFVKEGVIINFGSGRSVHTWRDFRATIKVIAKFVKNNRARSVVKVYDEGDGFKIPEVQTILWEKYK